MYLSTSVRREALLRGDRESQVRILNQIKEKFLKWEQDGMQDDLMDGLFHLKLVLYSSFFKTQRTQGDVDEVTRLHERVCKIIRRSEYNFYPWLAAHYLTQFLKLTLELTDAESEPILQFQEELRDRLDQDVLFRKLKKDGLTFIYDAQGIPHDEQGQIPPRHFAPPRNEIERGQFVGLEFVEIEREALTKATDPYQIPVVDELTTLVDEMPISQFILERLIHATVTKELMRSWGSAERCMFCLEDLKVGDVLGEIPGCHHKKHHLNCITKWLSDGSGRCCTCNLDFRKIYGAVAAAANAAILADAPNPSIFIANHMRTEGVPVISHIKARLIFDSRAVPTIEVELFTNNGSYRASAPSISRASAPSISLTDAIKDIHKAVAWINNELSEALKGKDPRYQLEIDEIIVKTNSVLKLSGKLAVSIAVCRAGAAAKEVPLYEHIAHLACKNRAVLPVPVFAVINGENSNLTFKEIMIMPLDARNFEEALKIGSVIFNYLKDIVSDRYGPTGCNIGDDGILAPKISSIREGLDLVVEAIDKTRYNGRVQIGLNVGATDYLITSEFDLANYKMQFESTSDTEQNVIDNYALRKIYEDLCEDYPIGSIWHPFCRTDTVAHWGLARKLVNCQVVAADGRNCLSEACQSGRARAALRNAFMVEVNEVQTVKEVLDLVESAKDWKWEIVVSCISPRFLETFESDLAVGIGSCQIKAGPPCSTYNQLLRIEEELGNEAVYAGYIGLYPQSICIKEKPKC